MGETLKKRRVNEEQAGLFPTKIHLFTDARVDLKDTLVGLMPASTSSLEKQIGLFPTSLSVYAGNS